MKVVERWPTFMDFGDRERREQVIEKPEDALDVPWLAEKREHGELSIEEGEFVMLAMGGKKYVVALIVE